MIQSKILCGLERVKWLKLIFFIWLGIGTVSAPFKGTTKKLQLNKSALRNISAREGIIVDLEASSKISTSRFSYTDSDGSSGTAGTIELTNPCFTAGASPGSCANNPIALLGTTIHTGGSVSVGGNNQGAVVINFGSFSPPLDFSADRIHLGNPSAGVPLVRNIFVNSFSLGNSSLEIAAKDEGILGDLELQLSMNSLEFRDEDGYNGGTWARFAMKSITIDNGNGNPADLQGFTLDTTRTTTVNGTERGAIIVGAPTGSLTLQTGAITNDDCCNPNYLSATKFTGASFAGTSVEIGARQ